jgi:hypothetical protein
MLRIGGASEASPFPARGATATKESRPGGL